MTELVGHRRRPTHLAHDQIPPPLRVPVHAADPLLPPNLVPKPLHCEHVDGARRNDLRERIPLPDVIDHFLFESLLAGDFEAHAGGLIDLIGRSDPFVDGRVFVCAVGTGGTLAGVGMALKERKPEVRIGIADPMGAALYHYYKHGELKAEGTSISEGIGQGRITANLEDAPIDDAFQVPDEEWLPIAFRLLREEGLCLGGSSGVNVAGRCISRASSVRATRS